MTPFVLGVDGGGSKSHLAVFSADGLCLCAKIHGSLNYEDMPGSFAQLEDELAGFVCGALRDMGLQAENAAHAVFGLAGVDTRRQHEMISGVLLRLGFKRLTLVNDAFLGVAAGAPNGYGVCAINGTGATIAAIGKNGAMRQVGGVGALSGDMGGGGWYADSLLEAVYAALFRRGKKTAMSGMLLGLMEDHAEEDYVQSLSMALREGRLARGELNRLVFQAAEGGDMAALEILSRSARHYAGSVAYLARRMGFPEDEPLSLTLAGSVFAKEKCGVLPRKIAERLSELLPGWVVDMRILEAPPVAGAVVWALAEAGGAIGRKSIGEECARRLLGS
jgi:N-acetylglucosamine kinase-like BadF-type ATPase